MDFGGVQIRNHQQTHGFTFFTAKTTAVTQAVNQKPGDFRLDVSKTNYRYYKANPFRFFYKYIFWYEPVILLVKEF